MTSFLDSLTDLFGALGDKLAGWGRDLFLMLPNIVAATLILVLAWFVSKLVARGVCRLLGRATSHRSLNDLVRRLVRVAVIIAGGVIALQVLELEKAATTFLAGAGIIGLALGFAFQDLSANFIAGVALAVRRPMSIGDIVSSGDVYGRVEAIHLRTTSLRQPDGKLVMVPNRTIFERELTNYSEAGKLRVEVPCGVSYDDDLAIARDAALEAIRGIDHLEDEPVEVYYGEFGDSSINLTARFWVPYARPVDLVAARSNAVMAIKRAFDRAGITIPFPIRTLDLSAAGDFVDARLREREDAAA